MAVTFINKGLAHHETLHRQWPPTIKDGQTQPGLPPLQDVLSQ